MISSTFPKRHLALTSILATAGLAGISSAQGSLLDYARPEVSVASGGGGALTGSCSPAVTQTTNQINGYFSDPDCGLCGTGQQLIADNFTLASATNVCSLTVWGGSFPNNNVLIDNFRVEIFSDAFGLPGASLYLETGVLSSSFTTGTTLFGVDEQEYTLTFAAPVPLPAGFFHLAVSNDTTGDSDTWFWETGDVDATFGTTGISFAFEIPAVTWNIDSVNDTAFVVHTSDSGGAVGTNYCTAGSNSVSASGSAMSATGSNSIAAANLTFSASNAPPTQPGLFYFGPNQISIPFGNGTRCVGGTVTRMVVVNESGGTFDYGVDFGAYGGILGAMGTVNTQCWYRDPAGGGMFFNLSDGYTIVFVP